MGCKNDSKVVYLKLDPYKSTGNTQNVHYTLYVVYKTVGTTSEDLILFA